MLRGAADAAAGAHHALDKVFLQAPCPQEQEGFSALLAAGAGEEADVGGILPHLLHGFDDGCGHAARPREALAEQGGRLVILGDRRDLDPPGIQKRDHLAVGHGVVRVVGDVLIERLALLGDAGTDEYGDAVRILRFQPAVDRDHRRDCGGLAVLVQLREVVMHHGDERRAAGGRHLSPLLLRLDPLLRFIGRGHIAAEPHLHHVRKADLL